MKYKITVEEVVEYPEMQTVYEANDGKRYFSSYSKPIAEKTVEYKQKEYPTGKMLERTTEVYVQHFEAVDLNAVIKAANNFK